jgi:hypothetical protein
VFHRAFKLDKPAYWGERFEWRNVMLWGHRHLKSKVRTNHLLNPILYLLNLVLKFLSYFFWITKSGSYTFHAISSFQLLIHNYIYNVYVCFELRALHMWDLWFSRRWLWRMVSSGLLLLVALVRTEVSETLSASIIRVTRIGEIGTPLAISSNQRSTCVGC